MGFRLEGVGARYDGGPAGSPVLEGVDLRIEAGEALALVGPSGAGKTSLLRILNGTLLAHSGGVHIEGADPATLAPRALRRLRARLGFIHQDHALVPNLRVNQNVAAGRLGHRGFLHGLRSILWTGRSDLTEIHGLLERVGIPETLFLRTDTLSGGQQQRVAIARALFQDPVAILADEPVATSAMRNLYHSLIALPKSLVDAEVRKVVIDAAKVSIMLLFIIANAMLFAHVLTTERIPHAIAEVIVQWGLPAWGFLIIVNLLLLAAGNFMEPSAIILIMAPILFPIAVQLGIDPIHLGIIMVVNMEIGMITPPVGLNLFVTAGITGRSILWVVGAALPWLSILLVFLVIITYVPQVSLFLPEWIDQLKGYK